MLCSGRPLTKQLRSVDELGNFINVNDLDAIAQLPRVWKLYQRLNAEIDKVDDDLKAKTKLAPKTEGADTVDYKQTYIPRYAS